jgi:hypothetical protein
MYLCGHAQAIKPNAASFPQVFVELRCLKCTKGKQTALEFVDKCTGCFFAVTMPVSIQREEKMKKSVNIKIRDKQTNKSKVNIVSQFTGSNYKQRRLLWE